MEQIELKSLNRKELLELLYDQGQRLDESEAEVQELRQRLETREINLRKAGSIAEASLAVTDIFRAAQEAADTYLYNVKKNAGALSETADLREPVETVSTDDTDRKAEDFIAQVQEKANREADAIISKARGEADRQAEAIIARAQADASKQAEDILAQAQTEAAKQAEAIIARAESNARDIEAQAQADASKQAEAIIARAQADSRQIEAASKEKSDKLVRDAHAYFEGVRNSCIKYVGDIVRLLNAQGNPSPQLEKLLAKMKGTK